MKSAKPRPSRPRSSHRAFYRQGEKKIYVEPLADTIAVRYRQGVKAELAQMLHGLGRVRDIQEQRLLIVEFTDAAQSATALKQLQPWVDNGALEFVAPVLQDSESRLQQILTDEITVRFKSGLPAKRLKGVEQKYGVKIARRNEFVPNQFILKVAQPEGLHALEVASRLDVAAEVEFASPNFISTHQR